MKRQEDFETSVDLVMDAFIPPSYIPNEGQKLDVYKRIAGIENRDEAEDMLEELMDRFGEPPRSVQNLLAVAELKALSHRAYVTEIKQTGQEIRITLYEKARLNAQGIPELLEQYGRSLKFKLETNPYFLYLPGPPRKKRETVLDQVRGFVEDLRKYVEE